RHYTYRLHLSYRSDLSLLRCLRLSARVSEADRHCRRSFRALSSGRRVFLSSVDISPVRNSPHFSHVRCRTGRVPRGHFSRLHHVSECKDPPRAEPVVVAPPLWAAAGHPLRGDPLLLHRMEHLGAVADAKCRQAVRRTAVPLDARTHNFCGFVHRLGRNHSPVRDDFPLQGFGPEAQGDRTRREPASSRTPIFHLFLCGADRVQCLRIGPLDVLLQHTLVLEVYRLAAVPLFVDKVQVCGTDANVFVSVPEESEKWGGTSARSRSESVLTRPPTTRGRKLPAAATPDGAQPTSRATRCQQRRFCRQTARRAATSSMRVSW